VTFDLHILCQSRACVLLIWRIVTPLSMCLCLYVTLVSPAKTAEPIEMPAGVWTWVDPSNDVLDGGLDPPGEGAMWSGERASP